jgi:uncharacterized protein (TIGR02001 family)
MMKKVTLLIAAALLFAGATSALAEIEVSGDAYVGVFDKYLWRGFDLSGSQPVTQGGMDISFKNLTLSYWTNVQNSTDSGDGFKGGEANETDITVNYTIPVGEVVTVNLGNIYYTLDGLDDTNELYTGVALNTILAPTVKAYYDWDEFKDDRFYTLSIGHSFALGSMSLGLGALASYADNDASHEPWNAELSAGLNIPVIEQVSIKPTFLYSEPLGDDAKSVIETEMTGGVTVTLAF